jgi:hypothetical protein
VRETTVSRRQIRQEEREKEDKYSEKRGEIDGGGV